MLLKYKETVLRVLEKKDDQALVINCTQKRMPVWINQSELEECEECAEMVLSPVLSDFEELLPEQRRIAHERYTLVAGILPFIGDEKLRCEVISRIASSRGISKQTLRRYLCQYLSYQNISALAPNLKQKEDTLNRDQKNMRWALNKFFYTQHKNSLNTAYIMMLKHKYCDASGVLLSDHPSIHQFRYFYRKHRKLQTYYISRNGLKDYQRNNRPLLGNGVQEFAPSVGTGMLDSTICDIYLVNETGSLVKKETAVTFDEIDRMGKSTIFGKVELTKVECERLKNLAKKGVVADAKISDLRVKLRSAERDTEIWQRRYDDLDVRTRDYQAAMKLAPNQVREAIEKVLANTGRVMNRNARGKQREEMLA